MLLAYQMSSASDQGPGSEVKKIVNQAITGLCSPFRFARSHRTRQGYV